ncbi:MAG: type II toxin-antitoxin system RelB/DinJ family antitoxin [Spirochaetales bacterium]|nr:type II toxin-antitoxin system RelB/DinJ family antitoxin [Spirochaetales bacterium]
MQADSTSVTVRLNRDVKNQAQKIYSELGVDMTTAINVFLRQSIRSNGFPFEVNLNIPNNVTLAAMRATLNNEDMHGPFNSVEALMEDLNADD